MEQVVAAIFAGYVNKYLQSLAVCAIIVCNLFASYFCVIEGDYFCAVWYVSSKECDSFGRRGIRKFSGSRRLDRIKRRWEQRFPLRLRISK